MFSRLKPYLFPALPLLAVTFAIYGASLGHDFLDNWDDQLYVVNNPAVRGMTWSNIVTAFSSYYVGNYAPLHIISYMLDYEIWGLKASGFILTNILLHAANGILLYYLMMHMSKSRVAATTAAIVFLVHPVQVESVVWVSQRKNLLSMAFFLISFLLYLKSLAPASKVRLLTVTAVTSFVLALLSKSVAVIFPPVLIAYDICFLEKRRWRDNLTGKIPYLAAAFLVGCVSLISQSGANAGGRVGYHGGSPWTTALTMLTAYSRYLINILCPLHLSIIYPLPFKSAPDLDVILSGILLCLSVLLTIVLFRRDRKIGFWMMTFFIALLPVANIIPIVTLMNDRYLYFPMLACAACCGIMASAAYGRARTNTARTVACAVIVVTIVTLCLVSVTRGRDWQDSVTLWSKTAVTAGEGSGYDSNVNFIAISLADSYVQQGNRTAEKGDNAGALRLYLHALSHDPDNYDALGLTSAMLMNRGEPLRARPFLLRLTSRFKRSAIGYKNLGINYLLTNERQPAIEAFQHALALTPNDPELSGYLNQTPATGPR